MDYHIYLLNMWENVEAASFIGILAECLANSVVGDGF